MTENQIIHLIQEKLKCGGPQNAYGSFGDDGFCIPTASSNEVVVLSTDSFNEGTHFYPEMGYYSVGWKALSSALSDIYAMGARPNFYSMNLVLPRSGGLTKLELDEYLEGLKLASQHYGLYLLGGDVSSGDSFSVSFQVGGYQAKSFVKANSGAAQGDVVLTDAVSGGALLGLHDFKKSREETPWLEKFLFPRPSKFLGPWLGQCGMVTSLRDNSDGLFRELESLCDRNKLSLHIEALPLDSDFERACKQRGLNAKKVCLEGGEDYSLIWTVKPENLEDFFKLYQTKFNKTPFAIGRLSEVSPKKNQKLFYSDEDLLKSLQIYKHFG